MLYRRFTVAVQPDPFGFGGQAGYYTDTETGLILCTHRYYDPANGRWLTRDPIGYAGGVNLYGYVGNNPGNRWDPSGFWSVTIGVSGTGVIGLPIGIGGSAGGGIVIGDGGIGVYGSIIGGVGIGVVGSVGASFGWSSDPQPSGLHGGPIYGGGGTVDLGGGGSAGYSSPFPGSGGPGGLSGWKGGPSAGGGIGAYGGIGVGGTAVIPVQWPNPFQGMPGFPGGPPISSGGGCWSPTNLAPF